MMILVTKDEFIKIVNLELKKMPEYYEGLEVISVTKEKNIIVYDWQKIYTPDKKIDPIKFCIASKLIQQVDTNLKSSYSFK